MLINVLSFFPTCNRHILFLGSLPRKWLISTFTKWRVTSRSYFIQSIQQQWRFFHPCSQPVMEEDGVHQYWETVGGITNQVFAGNPVSYWLHSGIMGNLILLFSREFASDTVKGISAVNIQFLTNMSLDFSSPPDTLHVCSVNAGVFCGASPSSRVPLSAASIR